MKNPGRYSWILVPFLVLALAPFAQAQKLWSEVSLSKTNVYVGEPVQVSVKVYTSTWFTSGVDPGNVKVNGAFTVYFRSLSISKIQSGKTFPGVEMIFNVFPFDDKNVFFPSLDIHVESPKDGDYKGMPLVVKTKERLIKVKPIPPGFDDSQWLVTSNISLDEHWNGNIKSVKVGDVLERRITRTAGNTVSELIPPISWDSLAGVSFYPARSTVENHKTKTDISATRTETMRYLFEKEGEITLPALEFTWWNPHQQKVYKRTLKSISVDVQPNPELGMLASIRDSLVVQVEEVEKANEKEAPFLILGMSPKIFMAALLLAILVVFLFVMAIRKIILYLKERKQQYRDSEAYYFHEFARAAKGKNRQEVIQKLYGWIDHLKLEEPSLHCFSQNYGSNGLFVDIDKINKANGNQELVLDIKLWKIARTNFMRRSQEVKNELTQDWINPS